MCREEAATQAGCILWLCGAMMVLGILLGGSGCAGKKETLRKEEPAPGAKLRIAAFPVENLAGKPIPSREIRSLLIERLKAHGIGVLDDASLDAALTKSRIRYTAGVDRGIAKALKDDTGVEAILIPSVELYDELAPPKVAMFWRLVSTGENPVVLWIDGTGLAGDDSPGILELGLIENPWVLLTKAVESLASSLAQHGAESGEGSPGKSVPRKFRPKIVYRSAALDPDKKYSIAVMPFFNMSGRKYAGEIIALHMIRNLMAFQNFDIVEPGIVRQELLTFRIIMREGVSLPETETVLNAVNADLVLNGEVLEYQDYFGFLGFPKVDFSVLFIERKTRRVVYSSYSDNRGIDGVYFFDWGKVNTAHAMASQMARAIGERMLRGPQTTETLTGATGQKGAPPK